MREEVMKEFIKVMKALADPVRIKIIKMLETRDLCVCEIREMLGIPQPTVSKHLKALEEAGLIGSRREGLWVNYYIQKPPESEYARQLLSDLNNWFGNHPEIRLLLKALPIVNREQICRKNN